MKSHSQLGGGCGCGGSCCDDHSLGALTPQQAADSIFPSSQIRSTAGFNQAVYDDLVTAAQTGQFTPQTSCPGVSAGGNIKIIQTASSLALAGVSMALTATGIVTAAALAPFTFGISSVIGLLGLFFAHHAAAVAQENKVICATVPATNNYLQQIVSAVNGGLATPTQGIAALQRLQSDFAGQVGSIIKNDSSHCNAACVWTKELASICAELTSQFQDMITAANSAPPRPNTTTTPTSSSTGSPTPVAAPASASAYSSFYPTTAAPPSTTPNWLPIAAIGVGAFLLLRGL